MKTLKKTLCLVLAMVMVFGLCTISASAKLDSYSDKDAIKYEEAVDVLSGIGILQGSGGAFRPQATITRAEAAKIIAYLVIGDSKQADALKASSDPFTDVSADYWAAGYIAYCASVGIIKGMGDGSYHPLDNVKGLQFATMLLRALGYGKNGEFEGSDWAINASKWALSLKLFDGNLAGASATEDATREECALYAFNTITGPEKVTYSELLGGYTTSTNAIGNAANANANKKFQDDFKLKNTKDNEDYDAFGRVDGYYWYVNKLSNRVTNYYVDGNKLKETFTTAVTGADIFSALDLTRSVIDDADFKVFVNSEEAAVFGPAEEAEEDVDGEESEPTPTVTYENDTPAKAKWEVANIAKGNTTNMFGTGNGVATYVYTWTTTDDKDVDTTHIRICLVDTYLAKVTDVTKATATVDAKTEVEFASDAMESDVEDKTFETDEFKEGDYVLVTVADGKIQSMIPAVVKEAEITRYTTKGAKKVTAGGVEYETAKEQTLDNFDWVEADKISSGEVNNGNYNLYIDDYGYLIGIDAVSVATNYVYVAQFGYKYITGGSLTDDMGLTADVYYADGTNKVLFVHDDSAFMANYEGDEANTPDVIAARLNDEDDGINIYKISMKGGKAVLTDAGTPASPTKNLQVGITYVDGTNTADKNTVYFYVNGDYDKNLSVKPYTGVRNIPVTGKNDTIKATSVIAEEDDDGNGIAKAVLVSNSVEDESDETVYLFTGNYVSEKASGDKVKVTYMGYDMTGEEVDICSKTYDDAATAKTSAEGFKIDLKNQFVIVEKGEPAAYEFEDSSKIKTVSNAVIAKVNADSSITIIRAEDDKATEPTEFSVYWKDGKIVDGNKTKLSTEDAIKKAVNKDDRMVTVSFAYDAKNAITIMVVTDADENGTLTSYIGSPEDDDVA